jgi:hypothetical protein
MSDVIPQILHIAGQMPAVSLQDIERLALLDRLDVKFILHEEQFLATLERLLDHYRVLGEQVLRGEGTALSRVETESLQALAGETGEDLRKARAS